MPSLGDRERLEEGDASRAGRVGSSDRSAMLIARRLSAGPSPGTPRHTACTRCSPPRRSAACSGCPGTRAPRSGAERTLRARGPADPRGRRGSDHGVRADERTVAALDAELRLPHGRRIRDAALLPRVSHWGTCRRSGRRSPATDRRARPAFRPPRPGRTRVRRPTRRASSPRAGCRYRDVDARGLHREVDGLEVLAHDLLALARSLRDGLLDLLDRLLAGQHAGHGEEARLQHACWCGCRGRRHARPCWRR